MDTKRISFNEIKKEQYIKLYKFLFHIKFKNLSNDAKILYCILRDRMNLSLLNTKKGNSNWIDKDGNVFIYITIKEIQELLQCSDKTATKAKKDLEKYKLIEDNRSGLNKPNKIYILNIDYKNDIGNRKKYDSEIVKNTIPESENLRSLGIVKNTILESENLRTNKNNNNKTYNKTYNNNKEGDNINTESFEILSNKIDKIGKLKKSTLKGLINRHGIEKINKYIDNFDKFGNINIKKPIGFLIRALEDNYQIPKSQSSSSKPIQSTNFDQREYDDDFFESLYENNKF